MKVNISDVDDADDEDAGEWVQVYAPPVCSPTCRRRCRRVCSLTGNTRLRIKTSAGQKPAGGESTAERGLSPIVRA